MRIIKRAVAAALVSALALSFTACSGDTTWAAKTNDEVSITSGVYLTYLISAYSQAQSVLNATADTMWDQKIEEKDTATWITDKAISMCKNHIAAGRLFEELGLTLSEDDQKVIQNNVDTFMEQNGTVYANNGAAEKSIKQVLTVSYQSDMIFDYYYSETGKEPVSVDEIQNYFYENYALVRYTTRSKLDSSGNALSDTDMQTVRDELNGYITQLNRGDDFDTIIDDYRNTLIEELGLDASQYGPDTSDPDRNKALLQKSNASSSVWVETTFQQTEYNVPYLCEDDNTIYLSQRLDLSKETSYFDDYRDEVLKAMKDDDYQSKLDAALEGITVTFNDAAISRYSPRNVDLTATA